MTRDQLRIFSDVFHARGLAEVARSRGLAPSTVSRAVASLEAELGVRLFNRTTRQLSPTEDGMRFHARVAGIADELDAAVAELRDTAHAPTGLLRVSLSASYGREVVVPRLPVFLAAYPDIRLDLLLSDSRLDMVGEGVNVAVRHGRLADSTLVARKLADVRYRLVASPAYLDDHGTPGSPNDLARHRLLTFAYPAFQKSWAFRKGATVDTVAIDPVLSATNGQALRDLAFMGQGIAILPDWLLGSGSLVPVLEEWEVAGDGFNAGLWLITPSRAYQPSRTRAFIDFLLD